VCVLELFFDGDRVVESCDVDRVRVADELLEILLVVVALPDRVVVIKGDKVTVTDEVNELSEALNFVYVTDMEVLSSGVTVREREGCNDTVIVGVADIEMLEDSGALDVGVMVRCVVRENVCEDESDGRVESVALCVGETDMELDWVASSEPDGVDERVMDFTRG
jgi:hypothetical protein